MAQLCSYIFFFLSRWNHPLPPNYASQKLDICSHSMSHPISTKFYHLKSLAATCSTRPPPISALVKALFAFCLDSCVGLLTGLSISQFPSSSGNATVLPNFKDMEEWTPTKLLESREPELLLNITNDYQRRYLLIHCFYTLDFELIFFIGLENELMSTFINASYT